MAHVFMARCFEVPVVEPVSVTITGTGDEDKLYCVINGTKYSAAASGIRTLVGSTIVFQLKSTTGNDGNTYPAFIEINGTETSTATIGKQMSYTIPDGTSSITIKLSYNASGNSRITVTTA